MKDKDIKAIRRDLKNIEILIRENNQNAKMASFMYMACPILFAIFLFYSQTNKGIWLGLVAVFTGIVAMIYLFWHSWHK